MEGERIKTKKERISRKKKKILDNLIYMAGLLAK
jgi:hypothetical protein